VPVLPFVAAHGREADASRHREPFRSAGPSAPGELSWRDENWSAQTRHAAAIREQDLIEALQGMKWMIDCCRGLVRIGALIANENADLPDNKVIDPFMSQVNWWLPEWGGPQTTPLTVGHVRLRPGEVN
jgi:hypothetical protein